MASILLLEDDRHFSELLAAQLRLADHKVTVASTGREATEALKNGGTDLVIVDGLLPDTNGPDWIAGLRAAGNQMAVVFVSSFWRDFKSYQHLTGDLGVMLVVHKPVQIPVLTEQIEQVLPKANRQITPSAAPVPDPEFQELCREFRESLTPVVKELGQAVARLLETGYSISDMSHARVQVHNIRGTAASYELPDIGSAAANLEYALVALMADPADRSRIEMVRTHFSRFAEECQTAVVLQPASQEQNPNSAPVTVLIASKDGESARTIVACGNETGMISMVACTPVEAVTMVKGLDRLNGLFIDLDHLDQADRREIAGLTASLQGVPVALIGADDHLQNRIDAAHLGAERFLEKPLDPQAVRDTFREFRDIRRNSGATILIVDDDDRFSALAADVLSKNGFSTFALTTTAHIMEALAEVRPDLLMLDVLMPGVSGFDVCKLIRQSTAWRNLPIVVTTALTGLDVRLAAFKAGADDYLTKPFINEELLARIRVRLDRARLEKELAERDSLTGLMLRRPFVDNAQAILANARRTGRPVSVCLIDIDRFKLVNDKRGHLAGDRVLSGFGRLVQSRFRREDLRGRWGGEEFVLVLPGQSAHTAGQVLNRLLDEFSEMVFRDDLGSEFKCSFSAGVASHLDDGETLDDLLKAADRRLYRAKETGRRQVVSTDDTSDIPFEMIELANGDLALA